MDEEALSDELSDPHRQSSAVHRVVCASCTRPWHAYTVALWHYGGGLRVREGERRVLELARLGRGDVVEI